MVFAPTDAAFARVPESTRERLENDRTALRRVLLYRVLGGRYRATRLRQVRFVRALAGRCVFEGAAKAFWYIAPTS
jgi:uncharacterized surface protein with fasciclin (FAS1) repeats